MRPPQGAPVTRVLRGLGADWLLVIAVLAAVLAIAAANADPSGPAVTLEPVTGFGSSEPQDDGRARWVLESPATATLAIAETPRSGRVVLRASSFRLPRAVTVAVAGRPLARTRVPANRFIPIPLNVAGLPVGTHAVRITSRPGPESLEKTSGGTDMRTVSLRLSEPLVVGGADRTSTGQVVSTASWWIVMLAGVAWLLSLIWRAGRLHDARGDD